MFEDVLAIIPSLVRAVISLFIIVDPFGNIPIFISLTENVNKDQKKKIFYVATLIGVILLLSFALAGQQIFNYFAVSLQSFMIAGGILLLIIAVKILIVGWKERTVSPESVGAVPIAVPLLVGPGAITTTIFNLQEFGIIVTTVSVLIVFAFVWLILRFIDPFYRLLGKTGSLVIARVMALLTAAIAVQYMLEGIRIFLEQV